MKILIAGDFCERYRVADLIKTKSFNQVFDDDICDAIQTVDYSIVNFEFPIVVGGKEPIVKCGPNLKGTPNAIYAIKYAGFKCATLANNHILDYGPDALLETKKLLEKNGIDTVGVGVNLEDANTTLYKNIGEKKLAIINCCEHEFSIASNNSPGANPLNPVSQYYTIREAREQADYVLVIVHGGHEHWQLPSPRMVELYHYFVDCGADAVVNHHQHCFSGSENYKGRPIIYGLGNFCFDIKPLKTEDIWNYGCLVEIEFNDTDIDYKLLPIKQFDELEGVRFSELEPFNKKQLELNAIIADKVLLSEKTNEFYKESMGICTNVLNPTMNRYLLALQRRKLLKMPLAKEWLLRMQNFIICESQRDRLDYFFNNYKN